MAMEKTVIIVTVLIFVPQVHGATADIGKYKRYLALENFDVEEQPFKSKSGVDNVGACGLECFNDPVCLCMRFHEGMCSLFNSTPRHATPMQGLVYFRRDDGCPVADGYISIASPRLCYKLSNNPHTWTNAQDKCQSQGGRLIIVNTIDRFNFLKESVIIPQNVAWAFIGLRNDGSGLAWPDGTNNIPQWGPYQPNGGEECGWLEANGIHDGGCDSVGSFLCEVPV